MASEYLTGQRRYRLYTRMFASPALVLQVEVHSPTQDLGFEAVHTARTYWRDATVEDLTAVDAVAE